jgi:hypothetical protein
MLTEAQRAQLRANLAIESLSTGVLAALATD